MENEYRIFNRYYWNDEKMQKLTKLTEEQFGEDKIFLSYALYNYLMEMINNNRNKELLVNEEVISRVALFLGIGQKLFYQSLELMFVCEIFDKDYFNKTKRLFNVYECEKEHSLK